MAASSVCWAAGGGSEVPPSCAKAGVKGKRQSAKIISNRIKVAALIKSKSVESPRSIKRHAWLFDYETSRRSAAEVINVRQGASRFADTCSESRPAHMIQAPVAPGAVGGPVI